MMANTSISPDSNIMYVPGSGTAATLPRSTRVWSASATWKPLALKPTGCRTMLLSKLPLPKPVNNTCKPSKLAPAARLSKAPKPVTLNGLATAPLANEPLVWEEAVCVFNYDDGSEFGAVPLDI